MDDNVDSYPFSPDNNNTPGPSDLEIGRALVLGAVFGETGLEGGFAAGYIDEQISSSPYYLLGWIGFRLIPVAGAIADARDAVQAFINGDELGVALNAAGAFSGIGDGVKTVAAIKIFIAAHPSKILEICIELSKYLNDIPEYTAIKVMDALCGDAASVLCTVHNVPHNKLIELFDKGADLKTVKTLLENVYRRKWSPGTTGLDGYFAKHGSDIGFNTADPADKERYFDMAIELINQQVGVEKHYDINHAH